MQLVCNQVCTQRLCNTNYHSKPTCGCRNGNLWQDAESLSLNLVSLVYSSIAP